MEVKIPARIGLSPPVVKFGLVWPKLADFVAIGPKFKTKTFLKSQGKIFALQTLKFGANDRSAQELQNEV